MSVSTDEQLKASAMPDTLLPVESVKPLTQYQKKKLKEKEDSLKGTGQPPVVDESMDANKFQQDVLGLLQSMQGSLKDLNVRVTRVEGKPIKAPTDFQAQEDENVPQPASKAVREVLGNKVILKAQEASNQPGFFLTIIVPDSLHTKHQIEGFKQQREVIVKDEATGRIKERHMEDWIQLDARTRYIPQFGMIEAAKKWAMDIADNINREYVKNRLPTVNFFE